MPSSFFVPRPRDRARYLIVVLYAALFGTLWVGPAAVRIPLGAAGLAVSLWLTWKLYGYTLRYYNDWIRTNLDPFGLSYYPKDEGPRRPRDRPLVVFSGDSRAQAWWPPPGGLPFDFENRAISGQTTTQVLHRFAADVAPLRPDVIVLQVGINDLKCLPFFPGLERRIIEDCKANIRRLVAEGRRIGATVVLTTIFPIGSIPLYRRPFWSDAVRDAVREVNHDLESLRAEGTVVLDTYALLERGGAVAPRYAYDAIHLNEAGYAYLSTHLSELLLRLGTEAAGRPTAD